MSLLRFIFIAALLGLIYSLVSHLGNTRHVAATLFLLVPIGGMVLLLRPVDGE